MNIFKSIRCRPHPLARRAFHAARGDPVPQSESFLSNKDICSVPLSKPLPGLPPVIYPEPGSIRDVETQVTVMPNGLKIASEKKFGQFCIAGVAISSGSRLEAQYPSGLSHFIERSAFRSTPKFASREDIVEKIAHVGGTLDCQGSRDLMVYAVSVANGHLNAAVELLGEVVLRPKLTSEEIRDTVNRITFELEDMNLDPERKTQLVEMIHLAAYGNKTLGLPKMCPQANLNLITPAMMFNYLKNVHTPDKMVLAGVGVEHNELVKLAQEHFVDQEPIWLSDTSLPAPEPARINRTKSQYVGGYQAVEADLSNVSLGPSPLPNLVHFQLGFEVCPHTNLEEFVIVCVMNILMGGGGSFSAGGPGKGMFTRLFTNVLNRHHWVNSSVAHNVSYEDSGLFYIQSSSDPSQLKNLVDIVIHEFKNIADGHMSREELARAKRQLISMLWLNLEIRPIVFEDVARQVLASGFKRQPKLLIEKIEAVSEEDIKRVAAKMVKTEPAVALLGDLRNAPTFDYIKSCFR